MSSSLERLGTVLGRLPAPLVVAIVIAVAQLPIFDRTIVSLDEGQLAAIGHRLVAGEVLYRDIYTGIFPGIYWFAEALFRVLGSDVLVLRWTQVGVNSVIAALLFALARPMAPGRAAWAVPIGYWVLLVAGFPVFTMLTYSSMSLVSALWCRREGRLAATPLWRAFDVPLVAGAGVALVAAARVVASGAWPSFFESTFLTLLSSQVEAFNQPLPPVFGPHPGGIFVFLYGPGALFGALMRGDPLVTSTVISWAVRLGYGSAYLALALVPLLAIRMGALDDRSSVRITARVILP